MYSSHKNNLTTYSIAEIVLVLVLLTQTWCFPIDSSEDIYAKTSARLHRKLNDLFLITDQFKYNKHKNRFRTLKYWCVMNTACHT